MPRSTLRNILMTVANGSTHTVMRYHIEPEIREFTEEFVKNLDVSARPTGFDRYSREWLDTCIQSNEFTIVEAKVDGRLNAGLGNASIHEVGFSFHHTYGVPYLPGSTIKGWLAAFAKKHVNNLADPVREVIFGTQDQSGIVAFHDALPKNRESKIATDIVNPHQKYYYRGTHNDAPSDMDTPVVVQFVTIVKGSVFYIPIQCEDANFRRITVDILKLALQHSAIGAKTNAGYGRMSFVRELLPV